MKHYFQYFIIFLAFFCSTTTIWGQRKMTRAEYIDLYKEVAIEKMQTYGIPASITLAQGILESGCGGSDLAIKANNHFGIKCHKGWTGKTFTMDDDEKNECFRKYDNAADSYRDHSLFLTSRERYADLFTLKSTDYKGWAYGLKKAGYATNPQYPQLLIKIIEEENLHQYDLMTTKDLAKKEKQEKEEKQESNQVVAKKPDEVVSTLPKAESYMKHTQCETSPTGRPVYCNNGVKYVLADAGENLYTIAQQFGIYAFQLFKYNELTQKDDIKIGDVVYLQPKKKKGEQSTYTVLPGETLRDISQKTGVKLQALCKYNGLNQKENLSEGSTIYLQKTNK